jgi:DNA-binding LacI/PurR family transcriptional regulator
MKRKVTINDIAEMAGVSKATVSFYLNGKFEKMSSNTYERIKEAIEETGYNPSVAARSLNAKSSHLFGVIIGDITRPFANRIVKGIEDFADENDYMTLVASSEFKPEREKTYIKSMLALGVDGFLIQPSVNFNEISSDLNIDKPIVFFDSAPAGEEQMYVKTDNYESVNATTRKLIRKGYRHFIIVSYNPFILQTRIERSKGCIDVLEKKNINYDQIILPSDATVELLSQKLFPLLNQYTDVCIFTLNSTLLQLTWTALGSYRERIPEIGLIGYDYETWCEFVTPSITTICQPSYQEGYTAAGILYDAINGDNKTEHVQILRSTLMERQSTKLKKKS